MSGSTEENKSPVVLVAALLKTNVNSNLSYGEEECQLIITKKATMLDEIIQELRKKLLEGNVDVNKI